MTLKIYNDLTRKKETFKPLKKGEVGIYTCGPTIYDYGHVGHGRSAVAFDIIRRYFIYKGYTVKYIFNYTDIDDKIINRARENHVSVKELSDKFEKIYDEDYKKLHILKPSVRPKATEVIKEIIEMIKKLEEKGYTYIIKGDGVYYDVLKFKDYGKLSHQNIEDLKAGARVEVDDNKKNPQDFVLWKFKKEGEPFWTSPWGEGRPGWHIECSAMSKKFLGETFDIHGGGRDLIFPHHEDELAQSEAANDKPMAKYWMHNGFIEINKEKMSKSLNNFFTMRDSFKSYDPLTLRYFFLLTHYKAPINFTEETLDSAKNSLNKIQDFYDNIKGVKTSPENKGTTINTKRYLDEFESAMDDDFNLSKALAAMFELMKDVNKNKESLTKEDVTNITGTMEKFDSVLAILNYNKEEIAEGVESLIRERETARENKDWTKADKIRDQLKEKGVVLEDSKGGVKWKKIS